MNFSSWAVLGKKQQPLSLGIANGTNGLLFLVKKKSSSVVILL